MRSPVVRKKLFATKPVPPRRQLRKKAKLVVQMTKEDRDFAEKGIYINIYTFFTNISTFFLQETCNIYIYIYIY
jgi:hypothetical protein